MKRAHRTAHTVLWGALAPLLFAVFFFALALRPNETIEPTAPDALFDGARP